VKEFGRSVGICGSYGRENSGITVAAGPVYCVVELVEVGDGADIRKCCDSGVGGAVRAVASSMRQLYSAVRSKGDVMINSLSASVPVGMQTLSLLVVFMTEHCEQCSYKPAFQRHTAC